MTRSVRQYDRPIEIAPNIFWVGYYETEAHLACNPYLIRNGARAVLIDGGSRPDFPAVMMKILQAGISPENLQALIYQHFDPDLCGSMPHLLDISENPDIEIFTEKRNTTFINHYLERDQQKFMRTIDHIGNLYHLGNRELRFINTPYAHSPGSFVTYDAATKTLFSSDLFGGFAPHWELFADLQPECFTCTSHQDCPNRREFCPLPAMIDFHKEVMPCNKALRLALQQVAALDLELLAPHHGSIIKGKENIAFVIDLLQNVEGIGIDGIA